MRVAKTSVELSLRCYLTLPLAVELTRVVPKLKKLKIPQSIRRSKKALEFLAKRNVIIEITSRRGTPPKYQEETINLIHELKTAGKGITNISKETRIPKSSVKYILEHRGK